MNKAVKVFVEGKADQKFMLDYLSHICPECGIKKENIICVGGWTNRNNELIRNQLAQNTDNGGINLIVFDADSNFGDRKQDMEQWRDTNGFQFELFLFPNNQEGGALEHLLESIIRPQNQPIFDCWAMYEDCLRRKIIEGRDIPLTVPAKKTKIRGYLEALLGASNKEKEKINEQNRDYTNTDHWDLNIAYLNPLKDFLLTHLPND